MIHSRFLCHYFALLFAFFLCLQAQVWAEEIITPIYDSPPKYYRENQKIKGLCIDVLNAIEKKNPRLKFILKPDIARKRIDFGILHGTYELLPCAEPTEARDHDFNRIDIPIFTVQDVLVVRNDDPLQDTTLSDIRKLTRDNRIMACAGTGQSSWLADQKGLDIDISAPTPESALEKLKASRGRFVFISGANVTHLLKRPEFTGKMRILPTPVRSLGRYFYFSPHTAATTIAQVESALKSLDTSGELKKITSRYTLQ